MSTLLLSQFLAVTIGLFAADPQAPQQAEPANPPATTAPAPEAPASNSATPSEEPATDAEPKDDTKKPQTEIAVLGGGCFWCLDAVYRRVVGVKDVISGYAGGHVSRPTYQMVQTGATGHAEVVQIVFDPSIVTYERLLEIFWLIHDPTTLNRQGPDIGTEYRSIILVKDAAQAEAARKSLREAQPKFGAPIVTEITPLTKFWRAEAYHQDFYRRNKLNPYCRAYIVPKLQKLGVKP
jgi:peptide-methionine (S)-S-oxide reductase